MSNTSEADFLHHTVEPNLKALWVSLTGLLLVTATICNGWNLLCPTLFTCGGQSTTGHVLLGVLILNDLISSTTFYPAIVANIAYGSTSLWRIRCFSQVISFGGTLTAIHPSIITNQNAISRVYVVLNRRRPAYKMVLQKKSFAALLVASAFFISCLIPSISYMPPGSREIDHPYGFCGIEPYKQHRVIQFKLGAWVFVPTIFTSVSYCLIHGRMRSENQVRSMARMSQLSVKILWMAVL
ncbi:hypothetical protein RvY_17899 [Ramazzottius varieornatus]|uniref:G-protein coupled receptors family 1 profile domain-containing protein n=1 Tax=Ramazzottius varieornatus TaxID=947166 RepID=A0A1D1W3T4_RAMVA|nr:hypothetical protein RvY_17899 [Ramazzottius varieornatus]